MNQENTLVRNIVVTKTRNHGGSEKDSAVDLRKLRHEKKRLVPATRSWGGFEEVENGDLARLSALGWAWYESIFDLTLYGR